MMKPLLRLLRLSRYGLAVIALVLSLAADGNAQSNEWLLGVWTGTYSALTAGGRSGSVTLTVRDEAGTLKWTRTAESPRGGGKAEAEGVVTKFDASSAEFEGKVISHWIPNYVGTGVKMSLTGSPSKLSGSGRSERDSFATSWELTKGK